MFVPQRRERRKPERDSGGGRWRRKVPTRGIVSGEIDRLLTKIDDGTKRTSPRNGTLERKHLSSFF
ncbi:hypothetical protein CH063_00942 [Colletotrichum higginsianum]|uniref:Uncharacterized protein n=1 Tax=Colletotrichum higginsianum (strain IMI 349063) TaxID=759273 RepID=H1UZ57_COLHI|nr:hypothetical protein CH063_00942 [Colletotrichum higginsianum]